MRFMGFKFSASFKTGFGVFEELIRLVGFQCRISA